MTEFELKLYEAIEALALIHIALNTIGQHALDKHIYDNTNSSWILKNLDQRSKDLIAGSAYIFSGTHVTGHCLFNAYFKPSLADVETMTTEEKALQESIAIFICDLVDGRSLRECIFAALTVQSKEITHEVLIIIDELEQRLTSKFRIENSRNTEG